MKRDPWLVEFYILLLLFVVKLLCQGPMNSWRSLFLNFFVIFLFSMFVANCHKRNPRNYLIVPVVSLSSFSPGGFS